MIHLPANIKGLIFDCDGTLADTTPMHLEAWRQTLAPLGINCDNDFFDSLRGLPTAAIVEHISTNFGGALDQAKITFDKIAAVQRLLPQTKPIEHVAAVAHKYFNKLPMAVVSGGSRSNVMLTLAAIQMHDYFNPVITHDDGFPAKPSPVPFLEAAKLMDVEAKDCVVFEDGELGLIGAKLAGMHTIDVNPLLDQTDNES